MCVCYSLYCCLYSQLRMQSKGRVFFFFFFYSLFTDNKKTVSVWKIEFRFGIRQDNKSHAVELLRQSVKSSGSFHHLTVAQSSRLSHRNIKLSGEGFAAWSELKPSHYQLHQFNDWDSETPLYLLIQSNSDHFIDHTKSSTNRFLRLCS